MSLSDRVTVLRKGQLISTVDTADVDKAELARMMVGRDVVFRVAKGAFERGPLLLEVHDLRARGDGGEEALRGVSLSIRAGEILGLAGVSGNGQKELFEVLIGMRRATDGSVLLAGKDVTNRPPKFMMERGVAAVPEDRIDEGLVMDFRVQENLVLGLHRNQPYARWLFMDESKIEQFANESIQNYGIATPSAHHVTRLLSGGNLQKVILARELSRDPACLIANQPTRGLDVGATEYVHNKLLEQRKRGAATLLISEDLDEIFNLSDQIAVMFKGQIAGILDASEASLDRVGPLMAGIKDDARESV